MLDLYVCLQSLRYFNGVPSPVKNPQLVDMVIFRENTEDIYAGLSLRSREKTTAKRFELPKDRVPDRFKKVRFLRPPGSELRRFLKRVHFA